MHTQLREAFTISIALILNAVLLMICLAFTRQARAVQLETLDLRASLEAVEIEYHWRSYEGTKTGADVVDFIIRHRDVCDIVIRDPALSLDGHVSGYLTSGVLVMGLSERNLLPAYFWDVTFVYDHIIGGDGAGLYTATLLYDGQLAPEYKGGVQVRGGVVTGIEFVRR